MMTEPSDETFRMFHRYAKLVRRGLASPLMCSNCGSMLITGIGKDDELVLKCYACASVKSPGLNTLGNIRAIVKEHFIDD